MTTTTQKLDLNSLDLTAEKKRQLKLLFPSVFTESVNEKGETVEAVDWERLKAELGTFSEMLENRRERYGMEWPGKKDCLKVIQQPTLATLKPCREESVNFDTSENLFIEGDNLEVLKLLQRSYYGKVKMIYIDPPYNTGHDFIYPDDFTESLETYLQYTGQVDGNGRKISTNTANEGRFHSKWLNMMYPRLYLARNLLSEDGVIFISIDDNETTNLRKLCDEIFGEENFVATYVWEARSGRDHTAIHVSVSHEYILCYAKSLEHVSLKKDERVATGGNYSDNEGKYRREQLRQWGTHDKRTDRPTMFYPVLAPDGSQIFPIKDDGTEGCWRISEERMKKSIENNDVDFVFDGKKYQIYAKKRDGTITKTAFGTLIRDFGTSANGTLELKEIFKEKIFDTVKPFNLISHLAHLCLNEEKSSIILDFFSGSCTTAHAVLDLNREDGGQRKFIMVQLPEPCAEESEAYKAGYKTIAEIGKERIRRVIKKIEAEPRSPQGELLESKKPSQDLGFKVFKLDRSNFRVWDGSNPEQSEAELIQQLELHIEHVNPKASQEDLLYELLLKSGFKPTDKVEKRILAGKTVYAISDGALLICLENQLTRELIDAVAAAEPLQFLCLDKGFEGNDQLKANAVQTFNALNQGRDKETKIIFRTV